jgi:hypothetical protein
MPDLLMTPLAQEWVKSTIQRHSTGIFGQVTPAVIWSDARGSDGELLVPVDPATLVVRINTLPHMVLHNHDPGKPKGQVLEAQSFVSAHGDRFVVAILGFYAGGQVLDFAGLGLDTNEVGLAPLRLPALPPNAWVEVATDPREVAESWLETIVNGAPIEVKRTRLSHNAAESAYELIRVGLPYVVIVWNPFVTSIASESGKATYAAIHDWVRKLLAKLADRRAPILDIHSFYDDAQITFLLRGKDVAQHYAAHDRLPEAAARAAKMVTKLKQRGAAVRQLVYEFDNESAHWYPSHAILDDNRIVTDSATLIAIESLPKGLSLGLCQEALIQPIAGAASDEGIA